MSTSEGRQKMTSGIQTAADGTSYIPSSKRADGSTRKEIRVRPGYTPPEDVQTYKNRNAEAFKNKTSGGVPGAESVGASNEASEAKSKSARRRENARKKAQSESSDQLATAMKNHNITGSESASGDTDHFQKIPSVTDVSSNADGEGLKKVRNQLKKLRAVRELKEKKAAGEKLSHDQLVKIGKEEEILRDLKKLGYDGPEIENEAISNGARREDTTTDIVERG